MPRRNANSIVQTGTRMKEALRRKLEMAAKHNEISFNQEVINRLVESFQKPTFEELINRAEKTIGITKPHPSNHRED